MSLGGTSEKSQRKTGLVGRVIHDKILNRKVQGQGEEVKLSGSIKNDRVVVVLLSPSSSRSGCSRKAGE